MYPEIEEILNRDTELAKQFYRFDRGKTIAQLWNNTSDKGVQLNVNNIIRIVNQIGPNDERLKEVFAKRDRAAHQETENSGRRKRFEPFKTLGRYKVFQAQTRRQDTFIHG